MPLRDRRIQVQRGAAPSQLAAWRIRDEQLCKIAADQRMPIHSRRNPIAFQRARFASSGR